MHVNSTQKTFLQWLQHFFFELIEIEGRMKTVTATLVESYVKSEFEKKYRKVSFIDRKAAFKK